MLFEDRIVAQFAREAIEARRRKNYSRRMRIMKLEQAITDTESENAYVEKMLTTGEPDFDLLVKIGDAKASR